MRDRVRTRLALLPRHLSARLTIGIDDHDTFTGLTQLQAAAADGNVDKVVELLDAGADADIQANGEVRQTTTTRFSRTGTRRAFVARAARSGPRLVRTRDRGVTTDHRTSIASIGVRESPAIPRRAPRRDAVSPPIHARAFVGRRALFPDTFPPGASPRSPARVPDLTSRLTNPPHANHSTCSRFAELRQDRRDDRRLERLHRDPQSDGARSFAAEPEGCGRRHLPPCPPPCTSTAPCSTSYVSHTLRRTISARRVQPVSRPGREPAIAPAVTNSPDRARSPIASREILVSAKTGGIFFPGSRTVASRGSSRNRTSDLCAEIRRGEKAFSAKKPFAESA